MSGDPGGPLFGGGGYYGASSGPGPGGPLGGLGGLFGPRGNYGAYPGCGCSSIFIILAGILLVMGGCLRAFNF